MEKIKAFMRDFNDDEKVTVWHLITVIIFCILASYLMALLDLKFIGAMTLFTAIVVLPIKYLLLVLRR